MKTEIISLAHDLKDYVVGCEGNVSVRLDDNLFAVKASGTYLSNLREDDLVVCNNQGSRIDEKQKKPSIETGFHAWLLFNTDARFVAHTHPSNTLKILCSSHCETFANERLFPDQIVFNGSKSCIVPYANPGLELLKNIKESFETYVSNNKTYPNLILLKNHGIIVLGKTAKECLVATQICEKAADIFLGSSSLGNVQFISHTNIDMIMSDQNETYRKMNLK